MQRGGTAQVEVCATTRRAFATASQDTPGQSVNRYQCRFSNEHRRKSFEVKMPSGNPIYRQQRGLIPWYSRWRAHGL
jgi:hypothetical protein